jgi:hypothetical protein
MEWEDVIILVGLVAIVYFVLRKGGTSGNGSDKQ